MPLYRIAELEIDPDQLAAYTALLKAEIAASIAHEPGVLFLLALADATAPHHIQLFEGYRDQAAYEAHLASPHFLTYKTGTAGMVKSLRLREATAVGLAAKAGLHEIAASN